mgnify:CR=1 FL=1
MAGKFFDNARGLPWIKSFNSPDDDEHADRLNHRYTVGFLLVCAVVASGSPFVFNRISCWVPAQFVGAYSKYTDNYCWISNTYYVPSNETVPHSKLVRERAEIGYYQWTPLIFVLFALCFYLPRMLWRSMNVRSGIDLQYLVVKSNEFKGTDAAEKQIVGLIEHYCEPTKHNGSLGNRCCRTLWCTSGKRLGNYLCSIYLITKLLYLINSFLQLALIHIVLGQPGWFYGLDIWYSVFVRNSVLTDSPYFPRVTLCDLHIREIGNLHRYTVQCVLPINMLNEKMFSLAWFWFIFVFLSNLFSFLSLLYDFLNPNQRIGFIRNFLRLSKLNPKIDEQLLKQFTRDFLMPDGVFIIKILSTNGSAVFTTGVVRKLFTKYQTMQTQENIRRTQALIEENSDV